MMQDWKPSMDGIIPPEKGYETDAGIDLFAPEDILINPGKASKRICLKLGFAVPAGCFGMVTERSSQGKRGVFTLGNIVDFSYTGDVHVTLANLGDDSYLIKKGEKICQIIFIPCITLPLRMVDKLPERERGN